MITNICNDCSVPKPALEGTLPWWAPEKIIINIGGSGVRHGEEAQVNQRARIVELQQNRTNVTPANAKIYQQEPRILERLRGESCGITFPEFIEVKLLFALFLCT